MHLKINFNPNNLNKIGKIIIVFLFLFMCKVVYSQNTTFHLDSVLYFEEIPVTFSNVSRVVSAKADDDKIYTAYVRGNQFVMYNYNYSEKELSISTFKLTHKHSTGTRPYDFVVTDKFVYVLLNKEVHCLSRAKKKVVYSFYCGRAEYLFLSGQHLITGFYYNYHPKDSKHKAGLRKFDLEGNKVDSIFLDVPFPEYTHYLPRNLISFNGDQFVFPFFDGLNLLFVDNEFKNIHSVKIPIEKFDSNWVSPSISLSESVAKNIDDLSLYWRLLDNSNSKKISRIEYVEFLDSATLLVRWYSYDPQTKYTNRFVVYLVKDTDSWKAEENSSFKETPLPFNTNLNVYNGGMPLLSQNYFTTYSKDYIYQVKIDIPYIESVSYKEYYQRKKEKEKKLEPVISLWIFKYD